MGGGVRDLLLDGHPKDFDIATDASPEEVKSLFRNCRLIGRRFRLAHVYFDKEIIEVATFRAHHEQSESEGEGVVENGRIIRDNVFGNLEDDAWRRDFTVNALYYNIEDFSVVDHTSGMQDLQARILRMIGDPEVRIQEDPVRMLRAIRFAAKLDFQIENKLSDLIVEMGEHLTDIPAARLFDEVLKLFLTGHALKTYELLKQYKLFTYLFLQTGELIDEGDDYTDRFIHQALINTDERISMDKPVTPAFLFAVFLWGPVKKLSELLQEQGMTSLQALQVAGDEVLAMQLKQVSLPKRFSFPMREIWAFQARLPRRKGKRAFKILEQPRFRAAYDFMLLRNDVGESLQPLCDWWTRFQEADHSARQKMVRNLNKKPPQRRRQHKSQRAG